MINIIHHSIKMTADPTGSGVFLPVHCDLHRSGGGIAGPRGLPLLRHSDTTLPTDRQRYKPRISPHSLQSSPASAVAGRDRDDGQRGESVDLLRLSSIADTVSNRTPGELIQSRGCCGRGVGGSFYESDRVPDPFQNETAVVLIEAVPKGTGRHIDGFDVS